MTKPESRTRELGIHMLGLAIFLIITFGIAALGARVQPGDWYAQLAKPAWTPPGWLFGPVWTLLYAAMAVAAWMVWKERGLKAGMIPLSAYAVQLLLNGLWSWLFFGRRLIGWAVVDIFCLLVAILVTLLLFRQVRPAAGWLLTPYLLWVGFASILNFQIWRLNR